MRTNGTERDVKNILFYEMEVKKEEKKELLYSLVWKMILIFQYVTNIRCHEIHFCQDHHYSNVFSP